MFSSKSEEEVNQMNSSVVFGQQNQQEQDFINQI